MKLRNAKRMKKSMAVLFSLIMIFSAVMFLPVSKNVMAADNGNPAASFNLEPGLIVRSYLTVTDNGYMRVFYDGKKIGVEYYDDSFNLQSKKSLKMELNIWGGFYKGTDAYYIVEGRNNTAENDTAEVIRVIKYDRNWERLGAAGITGNKMFGGQVRYPFDYGCVEMTEYNGILYIVTGHEGYVDERYGQGHQGFLMITVDEATMKGKIADADLWHSFAQYIDNKNSDVYVLEQSEGSRGTILSKYDTKDSYLSSDTIEVLGYGGSRTSAWAIPCYASVDGIALSSDNVLGLGTSIDQSKYDNYNWNSIYNIYLTVTPMSDFSEKATKVKWLTNYSKDKYFIGTKITKINDNRFMVSWEEGFSDTSELKADDPNDLLSGHILHYVFIDGAGNKVSKEFTAKASISDCQPIVKNSQIVFYASNSAAVDFYSIDANTGAFSKKVYQTLGENVSWKLNNGTLTISGTGTVSVGTDEYSFYYSDESLWSTIGDKVKKIVIKKGITGISANTFNYLYNLKEVQIEDGLKSIGKEAFAYCSSLSKITIPSSVTSIGKDILWTGYYWVSDESHVVDAVIYSPANSYAIKYAKTNKIDFVAIKNPTSIELSKSSVTLGKGETFTVKATVAPTDATNKSVSWSTSDSKIVTVSNGKITAKAAGKATVTAKTSNGKTAKITVTVKNAPSKITLDKKNLTLGKGNSYTLKKTLPTGSASNKVTYTSSDKSVAAVSSDGKITAKKVGTATITVKTFNGKTATCKVTVRNLPTSVKLNKTTATLKKGGTLTLKATVSPGKNVISTVTWSSSNTKIATVKNGQITAKSKGTAVITVKTTNGKTARCKITVK